MSNLYDHARAELERAGLLAPDSDYNGQLGKATLELVETLEGQGHSGHSAAVVLELFAKLAAYQPLSPLTDDPDEWVLVMDACDGRPALYQNRRDPSAFSHDGGATYRRNGSPDVRYISDDSSPRSETGE